MDETNDDTVVISDGVSRLTLFRIGDPDPEYPPCCYPTRLEITSESFTATVEGLPWSYSTLCERLRELHKTLNGNVRFEFWNERYSLVFSRDGKGPIELIVELGDSRPIGTVLTVPISIDQSYLPAIISQIRKVFAC
jgi:hypothetical protein